MKWAGNFVRVVFFLFFLVRVRRDASSLFPESEVPMVCCAGTDPAKNK
jgi:hypothetical protein